MIQIQQLKGWSCRNNKRPGTTQTEQKKQEDEEPEDKKRSRERRGREEPRQEVTRDTSADRKGHGCAPPGHAHTNRQDTNLPHVVGQVQPCHPTLDLQSKSTDDVIVTRTSPEVKLTLPDVSHTRCDRRTPCSSPRSPFVFHIPCWTVVTT